MKFPILILLVFTAPIPSQILAQEVHTYAPSSPTSSSSIIILDDRTSSEAARSTPSIHIIDYGGLGGTQTLTTRNSQGNDFAVSLEGVRLNSPAQGDFDFGSLSTYGLGSAELIRGGYAPFSSSTSGELQLHLPDQSETRAKLSLGSCQSVGVGLLTPHSSISYDQSKNNYSYEYNGAHGERTGNFSRQVNARTWWRESHYQIWLQTLYTFQETPGMLPYLTPDASYQNINPTIAFQTRHDHLKTATWLNFQKQDSKLPSYSSASTNHWLTFGTRAQSPVMIAKGIRVEPTLEYTYDKLWHDETSATPNDFNTPSRNSVNLAVGIFANPSDVFLIHPHIRAEYISDLKAEEFSVHPGLGMKWDLTPSLSLRSNLAWISRAPDFGSMYFASPPDVLANRELKRQRSTQGDLGYEWTGAGIKISQSLFADRTQRLIKGILTGPVFQPKNQGTGYGIGLENEISYKWTKDFESRANYTAQYTSLNSHVQPLKATHAANGALIFYPQSDFNFDFPIYFRSSMKENDTPATTLAPQLDVGAHATLIVQRWKLDLRIWNLLGWHRIEKKGYPLAAEPYAKFSAAYDF